jgi:hypothetical protein
MKKSTVHSPQTTDHRQQTAVRSQKWLVILIVLLITHYSLLTTHCYSQGVSLNTSGAAPDNSAMLDVSGIDKGVLINRMTTAERDRIIGEDGQAGHGPAPGLLIFNTTTQCYEAYVNDGWYTVSCPAPCSPPATPIAIPPDNAQITTSSFPALWSLASGGPTAYFLDVSKDGFAHYESVYHNLNVDLNLSYIVTGLAKTTAYSFRVRAVIGTCFSDYSNTVNVTTH